MTHGLQLISSNSASARSVIAWPPVPASAQSSLNALNSWGDTVPGALKVANIARQGFSGHHFVIMALCSMVAAFLVNTFFAAATRSKHEITSARLFEEAHKGALNAT